MGSNEIRLRKQRLNPGRIARHRDYAELMRKHRRGLKTKQLLVAAIYIIIVLVLIILSFIAIHLEKQREKKNAHIERSPTPALIKALNSYSNNANSQSLEEDASQQEQKVRDLVL